MPEEVSTVFPYDKDDAAKDTDSTAKEVSEAWHTARDDAQKSGDLPERKEKKEKDEDEKKK
ncbi:hypothetical protein HYW61_01465 [candidate division WWE3 bacterium]|nr:hypothetical protein [candidate division WWE3 bacterium]